MELNFLSDFFAKVITGEAAVVGGMPVLSGDDEVVFWHQFVDDGNDLISAGDGEAAAGEEVVLDVDEEEGFHEW